MLLQRVVERNDASMAQPKENDGLGETKAADVEGSLPIAVGSQPESVADAEDVKLSRSAKRALRRETAVARRLMKHRKRLARRAATTIVPQDG